HSVGFGELSLHRAFQLACSPQSQRFIEDRASVELRMRRHVRVDGGQQFRIERRGHFRPPPRPGLGLPADTIPDTVSDTTYGDAQTAQVSISKRGADEGIRTPDPCFTKALLYP